VTLARRLGRLALIPPQHFRTAWWGFIGHRFRRRAGDGPLVVVQAVIQDADRVLLSVRRDLRGWELPGGNLELGESEEQALLRKVQEETGLRVEILGLVGEYQRTGFLPHRARVFRCRPLSGRLRPSLETPRLRWWDPADLPDTLFPWYRVPLADALAGLPEPVRRQEHQGLAAIWAGFRIDLRMRASGDRAG